MSRGTFNRRTGRLGAATIALICAPWAGAQSYHVIDLGTLDSTPASQGLAVNNLGQAVGLSAQATADLNGFLWDGTRTAVPPLAGDAQSQSFGLSDAGEVVSMSFDLGELNVHGSLWHGGVITDLGPLGPRGINNMGIVAGYWSTSTASIAHVDHAGRWHDGMLSDLGTLGGNFSYAAAVSNWGQVVGWSYLLGDTTIRATLWQNGSVFNLGTLGGTNSQAYDISRDSGNVVGVADTTGGAPHAFLFRVNAVGAVTARIDLGVLGGANSYAYGVNNAGQVVGVSDARAFLWQTGTMIDLNTLLPPGSGWLLDSARAINDAGQIVGTGTHHGQSRGFLLVRTGDLDADGDADLADFGRFAFCLGGPGVTTAPQECSPLNFAMSDSDGDGDADSADFAAFQRVMP